MRLKKLEIFGFKSFADKIEIQFDQGITAIVGPNGSGKSNIGDAVRWVLGEQNARVLRGGRMEDIIFSGTSRRKPLSYCEVNLTIDNGEGTLPIAYGEVTVTRRIFRSGESEYYINRQSCRLKDVVDLFRDTGIGKEGYSIVGQGQIAEIINSRPEDRRGAFHESAGIMKFRVRKEEAERRLENTRANLTRLNDITAEIGSQLEPLRRQSEDARLYLTLSEELKDLEINQYLLQYDNVKARIAALEEQKLQAAANLERQAAEVEALEEALRQQSSRQDELEERGNALRDTLTALAAEEQRRAGERNLTLERIAALGRDAERMTHENEEDEAHRAALLAEAETLTAGLAAQEAALRETQQAIAAREREVAEMAEQLRSDEEQAEAQKAELMAALNKMGDIRSTLARLDAMQESIAARMGQMDDAEQKLARELTLVGEAAAEIDGSLAGLQQRLQQAQAARSHAENEVRELGAKQRAAGEAGAKARERLQAAATRINMLSVMKRDYEGYAEAVKRLLVDCRKDDKLRPMVEGVIGELVEAPSDLVRAIEMVLGPAMQNIVTPDEEAAKHLINHLRRMNYGRATFLPVASVRGRTLNGQENRVLNMAGCVGVASELVKYDPRYRDIVQSLLGRTVIAEDMDSAIAMARACGHTLRFATLQGDIINTGGSMTGGSVHSRFTSLLGRSAELEELMVLRGRIEEELKTLAAEAAKTQEQGAAAAQVLEEASSAAHDIELEYAREQERRGRAAQTEERVRAQMEQLNEERQMLRDNLRDLGAERAIAESQQGGEEQSNASAREQIIHIQQQINEQRERLADLQEAANARKITLATDTRHFEAMQADRGRLMREAAELLRRTEAGVAALEQCRRSIAQEEQGLTQSESAAPDGRRLAAERELHTLEEQRAALRAERLAGEQNLGDRRRSLEEVREQQYKLQAQSTRAEADLENLQNRIWDNYELTYAMAQELRRADFESAGANKRINEIRERIRAMGSVNVNAIEDYVTLKDRWEEYQRQTEDLVKAEGDLVSIIAELAEKMEKRFREQFALLNGYFSETFTEMFGGGQARLVLKDESDLLNSGIEIEAQPPGKQLQMLSLLSGGEKSLTAISLLFAMLKLNPSPFCVLDEIEAALDDVNVKRFADYLNAYTSKTQFVVVTHRKGTMEASNAIYGVTMEEKGISTLVSMKMADYVGTGA